MSLKKVKNFVNDPKALLFTELTNLMVISYFLIKKITNISLTDGLNKIFHEGATSFVIAFLLIVILISTIIVAIRIVADKFFAVEIAIGSTAGSNELSKLANKEISSHIKNIRTENKIEFLKHHHFDINIPFIVKELSSHIRDTINSKKVKSRDIFISVYKTTGFEFQNDVRELSYLTHYDPHRDVVVSRTIDLKADKYKNYECVKLFKEGKNLVAKSNCDDYHKTGKRNKKIMHYIAFGLYRDDYLMGVVNIEFLNNKLFNDDDDLEEFVYKNLIGYKHLVEYQFLKRQFFSALEGYYGE